MLFWQVWYDNNNIKSTLLVNEQSLLIFYSILEYFFYINKFRGKVMDVIDL